MQGGYAGYGAYGQQPSQAQMYQSNETQYPPQPMVVIPQQPRHVVHQAPHYQPTSPPLYTASNGPYQQSPVQYPQAYQAPYQPVQPPQSFAQVPQSSPYQQHQYYQPQQVQRAPSQGYYQASATHIQPLPLYAQPQRQSQAAPQPRPQQRVVEHQAPAQAWAPQSAQSARPSQPSHLASRTPSRPPPAPPATQQRTVAHVQIPVQRPTVAFADLEMPREPKRRRSNDGDVIPVCDVPAPQRSSASQRVKQAPVASSPLTELLSSQMPPTPPASVDYQAVLLALADEYVTAAYEMSASLASADSTGEQHEHYHGLMSFAMSCLESVLKNYRQLDPRKEARIRLRLATLLHDETENITEAEEILSKGIALCERNRLPEFKYAMYHLQVRVMSRTSPKAAMKAIDKLVAEVEALGLAHWMYALRFLRVSLSAQTGSHLDAAAVLKHLGIISSTAEELKHTAVHIVAATIEAMMHLRTGGSDAIELAQRALAAARTHQLSQEMERMPQIRALLDCLDVTCAILQYSPDQIGAKIQQMQAHMDAATRDAGWRKDGSFLVPLGIAASDDIAISTGGVMLSSKDGEAVLAFSWLTNSQLYALGYLLSGVASMHKDSGDHKATAFLGEGRKLSEVAPDAFGLSLAASTSRLEWQASTSITFRLQLIFAYCGRSEWTPALQELRELHEDLAHDGEQADPANRAALIYLEAVCQQGLGDLEAAVTLYYSPELTFQPGSKDVNALRDMEALATLNKILILRSMSQQQQADTLHTTIEPYCLTHSNKALIAAYYIVKATAEANHAIIKRKQYLQSAVQAAQAVKNQQLLCVILNNMTSMFFHGIVGEQAMKSAGAGRTLAVRTRNKLWEAVSCKMFEDTFELCGERDKAAAGHRGAQQAMQALSPTLRQKFQEDIS
ncbi:hypothetical protein LTR36_000089 [Oleoguttula mirabilis]|uniref:Cohesin loading factor-domain-containing protein n=1 Tax=Oleoguttula mirabilis TaxID=1507867 RepID=A0AAV9JXU3_9PEZI|nr:hypothetical protein LTR36_000089 [Oleoguttula mirabilis]